MIHLRFIILATIAFALASCTGAPPSAKAPGKVHPETSSVRGASSRGKVERPSDTGLDAAAFAGLPEGVMAYLQRLAAAVRSRDSDFLLAQGERNYESRVRTKVDDEVYLALLYRIGPYAVERPSDDERPPRLDSKRLRSIRYTGWDERGPVAEIRGMISLAEGPPLPCRISVLWKLDEPRLLGQEP